MQCRFSFCHINKGCKVMKIHKKNYYRQAKFRKTKYGKKINYTWEGGCIVKWLTGGNSGFIFENR